MLDSKQLLKCCLQVKDLTTKFFVDGGIQMYSGCRPFRWTTYMFFFFPVQMTRQLSSWHINVFFSSFLVIHLQGIRGSESLEHEAAWHTCWKQRWLASHVPSLATWGPERVYLGRKTFCEHFILIGHCGVSHPESQVKIYSSLCFKPLVIHARKLMKFHDLVFVSDGHKQNKMSIFFFLFPTYRISRLPLLIEEIKIIGREKISWLYLGAFFS